MDISELSVQALSQCDQRDSKQIRDKPAQEKSNDNLP